MHKILAVLILIFALAAPAGAQTPVCLASPDGSCGRPTIKAASTAPAAADTSTVVGLSPNGGNPCANPSATLAMVAGQTSGTASVELIALSGSAKIHVCNITVQGISGTTPTFALRYGTGTACATGTVTIIGAFTTTANATFNWPGPAFVTPAGQALCYIQTGTTPVSNYAITYVQQP